MRITMLLTLVACEARMAEDPNAWWTGDGAFDEDVLEPLEFTQDEYAFNGDGLDDVFNAVRPAGRVYSEAADPAGTCPGWSTSSDLPIETWAMVTLHPRLYFKTRGCDRGSDEKYYGNYFLEDENGGIFVLNDSKVAHFVMGDRVRIRVNGIAEAFQLPRIMSHEILEVDRGPFPIKYTWAGTTSPSGVDEWEYDDTSILGKVARADGIVISEPDTFGQFAIVSDDGTTHVIGLDSELNRRKVRVPLGSRIQVTGPVLNAFGHKIVVMRVGQISILEE